MFEKLKIKVSGLIVLTIGLWIEFQIFQSVIGVIFPGFSENIYTTIALFCYFILFQIALIILIASGLYALFFSPEESEKTE